MKDLQKPLRERGINTSPREPKPSQVKRHREEKPFDKLVRLITKYPEQSLSIVRGWMNEKK